MTENQPDSNRHDGHNRSDRREFLNQSAGLAVGLSAPGPSAEAAARLEEPTTRLPTIRLGQHQVSSLIIGGNPIYGYSHSIKLLSRHQTEWHTPNRVVELLQRCEVCGLNTWQNSYADRTLSDLKRY